jgi:plastocyanin
MTRIASVVALLALGSGALAIAAEAPPPREVTMPGKAFAPSAIDVLTGTNVTWRNGDRITHTVTADDDSFESGFIRPGGAFSRTFAKTGTYAYHCTIHKFMRGTVRVFDVVLTGPDRPLPAGAATKLEGLAPAGVAEVVLERVSRAGVVEAGRKAPGTDGAFVFPLRAAEPATYRVKAGAASSARVRVAVAPHVSAAVRSGAIVVSALPARAGSRVAVQVYDRELFTFVTVARGRLGSSSRAVIPFRPVTRAHVRAVVRGREGWSDGFSPVVVVPPA